MPNKKSSPIVIVIGGGPAGLMAAGTAASAGARVLLFEKTARCGNKLLLTGSGKCNITNSAPLESFLEQFAENRKFLYPSFKNFFHDELEQFFNRYQVLFQTEENGKVFPSTKSAASVLDALLAFCYENSVEIHLEEPVLAIEPVISTEPALSSEKALSTKPVQLSSSASIDSGKAPSWRVVTSKEIYEAKSVILATGGLSYPKTGSTGDGYRLAQELSHTVIPTRPALVSVETCDTWSHVLSGISIKDAKVSLYVQQEGNPSARRVGMRQGDLLFTHYGLSGPAVLFLSRGLPDHFETLHPGHSYYLSVDLLPARSLVEIEDNLLLHFAKTPSRQLKTILAREFALPLAFALALVVHLGFKEEITGAEITKEKRQLLLSSLKALLFPLAKIRGYKEAMVTAGGVSTKEIRPQTMESKVVSHLFFAGELIDIDGNTGGFNLQAAFSTGFLAGENAAMLCRQGDSPCHKLRKRHLKH